MTSEGNQDWRGGRAPRNSGREEKAQPTWKQSRSAPGARTRRFGSKLRILLAIAFLVALVVTAIIIFLPERPLRTHFLVMNLLEGSIDFDAATAVKIDETRWKDSGTGLVSKSAEQSLTLTDMSDRRPSSGLLNSDVLVICLQTMIMPSSNGGFECLVKNSTPDLEDENESVSLSVLRDSLTALLEEKAGPRRVLLIIDMPQTNAEWRTGHLTADLKSELESWTSRMKELVVLLSFSENQASESSLAGSNGQTVFSHFVSCGLSRLADTADSNGKSDHDLTAAEFCSYVADRTNHWISQHRNVAGHTVYVMPPIEELRNRDSRGEAFTLVRDVPTRAATEELIPPAASILVQSELRKLWTRREDLLNLGGSRWSPLLWTAATDSLHRAETAWLRGQTENANRAMTMAGQSLSELEQLTKNICPEAAALHPERGLLRSDFEDLPSFARVADFWEVESSPAITQADFAAAEDVVLAQLGVFPFTAVGLPQPVSGDLESVRTRRKRAEAAAAQLAGCAWRVPVTVSQMESKLLLAEDKRFTRAEPDSTATADDQNPDALIEAITNFVAVHDAAELALCRALDTVPSLAYWCAHNALDISEGDREEWRTLLLGNSPDREMNRTTAEEMFDALSGMAAKETLGFQGNAQKLQEEAFRLLVYARGLQQRLKFIEPPSGFRAEELQELTSELSFWQTDVSRSLSRILQLIEETCGIAMDESPAERPAQVRVSGFLRSMLCVSSISAATREKLVARVLKWDDKFQETDAAASDDSTDNAPVETTTVDAVDEALWTLQIMNLMPCTSEQSDQLRTAWTAASTLVTARQPAERHDALSGFGAAVRKVWRDNRDNVRIAGQLTSVESHELLRLADQQARLFSGFDSQNPSVRSPTGRLRLMNRLQYCLLQMTRSLQGQWVEANDKAPWAVNGWYARLSRVWLAKADECIVKLTEGTAGPPAFALQTISDLRDRLQASEKLEITANPQLNSLNLGEQNQERESVPAGIVRTNPNQASGVASLLALPVAQGGVSLLTIENNALPVPLTGASEATSLNFFRTENPGETGCQPESFRTEVFFRGRHWQSQIALSVNPCAPAEFVVERLARPESASVTMSGFDPRPIAFILDWSGSMTTKLSSRPTSRHVEALDTLRKLIDDQTLRDSRVTLTVYGHRVKYDSETRTNVPNPRYQSVFGKPIPPDLLASSDGALEDIETGLFRGKADEAGRAKFKEILTMLERTEPWGITPLARAIEQTFEDELKDRSGIVIAVTDGEASDVGTAADAKTAARNARRLAELKAELNRNPSSKVVIVAFDFQQNQAGRKALQTIFVDGCGIQVVDAAEQGELLNQMYASLDPRNYSVRRSSDVQLAEKQLGETISELVPADDYEFRFGQISSKAPVSLGHGDNLKLRIDHRLQQMLFLRSKNPERKDATGPENSAGPDYPSMLRSIAPARMSDIEGAGGSGMQRAELSLMLDHNRDDLPVRQPKEIEFTVRPAGMAYRPPMIHQQYAPDTGAPGWLITITEWPKEQDFLVNAVWKMHRSAPELVLRWEELKTADSPTGARRLGGNGLPECTVWTTLRGDGILQVRLDRIPGVPYPEDNLPESVRVEIGKRDTLEQNSSFLPREITTRVRTTESGAVIYEFSGNLNSDDLASDEVAFTSATARRVGASEVRDFRIDKRR